MHPEHPVPYVGDGLVLDQLPSEAVVELRHVGGELRRARPDSGALASLDASHLLYAGTRVHDPGSRDAAEHAVRTLQTAMGPWASPQAYLNLAEGAPQHRSLLDTGRVPAACRIKAEVDPEDRIRANHAVPPRLSA